MKTVPHDFDRLGSGTAFRPWIPKKESIVTRLPQSKRLHRDGETHMAEIPLPWRAYAAHQSNLNSRPSIDALSWGMEDGPDLLLEGDTAWGANAVDIDRVVANGARRPICTLALVRQAHHHPDRSPR